MIACGATISAARAISSRSTFAICARNSKPAASHAGRSLSREDRGRRAALVAWQALAHAAQEEAQRHGALFQPCGDAVMLAFGAFEEQPAGESLRAALAVAESLQRGWRDGGINAGGPLVLSLAS